MKAELEKRLARIRDEAHKTFGEDHSSRWLQSPSRYFDGKSPLEFASAPEKADKVLDHVGYFGKGSV